MAVSTMSNATTCQLSAGAHQTHSQYLWYPYNKIQNPCFLRFITDCQLACCITKKEEGSSPVGEDITVMSLLSPDISLVFGVDEACRSELTPPE
jgi:hypothetical protein